MVPYYAATGHNLYLKTGWLYLQSMQKLKQEDPTLYKDFEDGKYTARRSDRFWGGIPTDQIIEQVLMRALKTRGGLTEKGDFTEAQRNVWLHSRNACAKINDAMQEFVDYKPYTSEQHRDVSDARLPKNKEDLTTVYNFLSVRNPFSTSTPGIMNIVSGVVGNEHVNIHQALDIGNLIIEGMKDKPVLEFKFKRNNQAVSMSTKLITMNSGKKKLINPQQMFMRLIAMASLLKDGSRDEDITTKVMLGYELCTYPPSLFEYDDAMLKAPKPKLVDGIKKISGYKPDKLGKNEYRIKGKVVIDGGGLIHHIKWETKTKFSDIYRNYVSFVNKNFAFEHTTTVLFDSYPDVPTTKDAIHAIRYPSVSLYVNIGHHTVLDIQKNVFLSNYKNKQSFVDNLRKALDNSGVITYAANDDADRDIVALAVHQLQDSDITLYGDDTDLIVLIIHSADKILESGHILYYHSKSELWNMNQLILKIKNFPFASRILTTHAFLGCDTTSRLNGFGKDRLLKVQDLEFWSLLDTFLESNKTPAEISECGKKIFLKLYKGQEEEVLNDVRYRLFQRKNLKKITVNDAKNKQQLADCKTLPPTDDAAEFHSLRVYHQVCHIVIIH